METGQKNCGTLFPRALALQPKPKPVSQGERTPFAESASGLVLPDIGGWAWALLPAPGFPTPGWPWTHSVTQFLYLEQPMPKLG